jgi:hypothetical protein
LGIGNIDYWAIMYQTLPEPEWLKKRWEWLFSYFGPIFHIPSLSDKKQQTIRWKKKPSKYSFTHQSEKVAAAVDN